MIFKRAGVRYSETPEPSTPYQAAGQVWDERIGSARVQARNWQLMALASSLLSVTLVGGLLWQSTRLKITPYIVEIDAQGEVKGVGPVTDRLSPRMRKSHTTWSASSGMFDRFRLILSCYAITGWKPTTSRLNAAP